MQPCTVYTYILKGYTFVNTAMPFKNYQNDVIFFSCLEILIPLISSCLTQIYLP